MKIGIDAHAVGTGLGGNETYISRLLDALGQQESSHEFVAYFASEDAAKPWRGRYENVTVNVYKWSSRIPRLLLELPARAAADRLDLLHVQFVSPPVCPVPVVPLIADISYEYFPQFFDPLEVLQFKASIRWSARRARRILTVSESSKRDLVNTYGVPPDKIDVAHLGVDLQRFRPSTSSDKTKAPSSEYGIREPYLLAVGNLQPRKNLVRLIEAFLELKRERPELPHSLALVGKAAYRHDEIFRRIQDLGLGDQVVFTGYVPDEDLPALYRGAAAFAYPSLYEGFGLPVAEAMACGVPVLTSNLSSMPEVAGDAAVLVDPEDTRSIAAGLLRILTDPRLAAELSEKGFRRARGFTWERTARLALATFEAAGKGKLGSGATN